MMALPITPAKSLESLGADVVPHKKTVVTGPPSKAYSSVQMN